MHHTASHSDGSTTIRLRTLKFGLRHFVYRHFVCYCIPACRTVIHPTSVSANHYFHQFKLLLTLGFLFINPAFTDTMIIQHLTVSKRCGMTIQLVLSVEDAYFHQSHS